MQVTPQERSVLESIAERGDELVARAVGWCAGNSGSRNLEGLKATLDLLTDVWSEALPGAAVSHEALNPTVEVAVRGVPGKNVVVSAKPPTRWRSSFAPMATPPPDWSSAPVASRYAQANDPSSR